MARYQITDIATGRKLNVVEWDGESPFEPQDGQRIEPDDGNPIWSDNPIPDEPAPPNPDNQLARALAKALGMTDEQLEEFRRNVEVV